MLCIFRNETFFLFVFETTSIAINYGASRVDESQSFQVSLQLSTLSGRQLKIKSHEFLLRSAQFKSSTPNDKHEKSNQGQPVRTDKIFMFLEKLHDNKSYVTNKEVANTM
jgi:cell division protein FtsB